MEFLWCHYHDYNTSNNNYNHDHWTYYPDNNLWKKVYMVVQSDMFKMARVWGNHDYKYINHYNFDSNYNDHPICDNHYYL